MSLESISDRYASNFTYLVDFDFCDWAWALQSILRAHGGSQQLCKSSVRVWGDYVDVGTNEVWNWA